MTRAETLYNYPLWDIKRFLCGFLKYAKIHAKEISKKYGGNWRYYFIDMIWCNFRYLSFIRKVQENVILILQNDVIFV